MRPIIVGLVLLILVVQYRIWVGDDSVAQVWRLQQEVEAQRQENVRLADRNARLAAEVRDLKDGLAAVEARAREELGMVREDETLYQFSGR